MQIASETIFLSIPSYMIYIHVHAPWYVDVRRFEWFTFGYRGKSKVKPKAVIMVADTRIGAYLLFNYFPAYIYSKGIPV